jgi:uncharacterized protein
MNLEMAPLGAMLAALATGLVGSVHCVGMCGTAATALLSRSPAALAPAHTDGLASIRVVFDGARTSSAKAEPSLSSSLRTSLAFNLGRLASYAAAGAILAGVTGALASQIVLNDAMPLRISIYVIGQLFVIAIGCYVAGFTQFLAPLERAGSVIWRRVAPFTRRWSSPKNAGQAFLLGGLWGWIPCGMVYGALASAMSSGGAVAGAMVMFAFGLGTLPAMLMMGAIGPSLRRTLAGPNLRLVLGMIVAAVGIFGLSRVPAMKELAVFSKLCVWVNNAVPSVLSIAAR